MVVFMSDSSNKPNIFKSILNKNITSNIMEYTKTNNTDFKLLNFYASLALYHPETTVIFSSDGAIININDNKILSMLHFCPIKLEDFKKFLSEDGYKNFATAFMNTLKGNSEKLGIEINLTDRNTTHILLTFIPITSDKTIVEGVFLIISNITEKARLRESVQLRKNIYPTLNKSQKLVAGNI